MNMQQARKDLPSGKKATPSKEPVPGLLEDIALAAAKIYYLAAAGQARRDLRP